MPAKHESDAVDSEMELVKYDLALLFYDFDSL